MKDLDAGIAGAGQPELLCYVFPGWHPRIRAAAARREWMDATPESFAYRCLPLKIANAHGWEMLSPCGFTAIWNGGIRVQDVSVSLDRPTDPIDAPVSLFGQGTLTFHVAGLLRTPPGWNLWVGGSPNAIKDAIQPLSAVIETDWSPYTFTMNWRFTRPHQAIRFEENEPFCFFFPIERPSLERFQTRIVPIDDDPALKIAFEDWSRSRDAFQMAVVANPPTAPADGWQKLYYRGMTPDGSMPIEDHQTKVSPCPFTLSAKRE